MSAPIGSSALTTLIATVGGRAMPSSNHGVGVRIPIGSSATSILAAAVGGRITLSSDGLTTTAPPIISTVAPIAATAPPMIAVAPNSTVANLKSYIQEKEMETKVTLQS